MAKKTRNSTRATAHAYTPGLKVTRETLVSKIRKLPIPGELLVKVGTTVEFDQSVARAYFPGPAELVKVTSLLTLEPEDLPMVLKKKVGDYVEKGETIAAYSAFFGLVKKSVESPITGTVESTSERTGRVLIRGAPQPIEISAYVPGKVVDTTPREAVTIETNAAFLQGIFGVGGETYGEIKVAVKSPDEELLADMISLEAKGKILVGGSCVSKDALRKAVDVGVIGIVVGGIQDVDLFDFLGTEIGVAITGQEEIALSLIITEGFGKMNMSERTFNLLQEFEGKEAAMNGATQIRAGVQRPELIIPHQPLEQKSGSAVDLSDGMTKGTSVRIIRQPYFGALGTVVGLPVELQKLQTESKVRVVEVEINGEVVTVPRANVEIITE